MSGPHAFLMFNRRLQAAFQRLPVLACLIAGLATTAAAESVELSSGVEPGDVSKVEAVLEVGGVVKFKNKEEIKTLPTTVAARFAYEERQLGVEGERSSVRIYRTAQANVEVNKKPSTAALRAADTIVLARAAEGAPEMLSPYTRLTADELELLQIPANSLLVEGLLPGRSVDVGGTWKHDDALLCGLLNLDAVSATDVQSTLAEVVDGAARIELKGTVSGASGGVSTDFELAGRYKFDLKQRRITWLALLLKENRSIGHVEPGLEVQARVQMLIAPTTEPKELAEVGEDAVAALGNENALLVGFESAGGRFGFEHDRRWHVMSDREGVLSMRLVDRGELVAQCNVTSVTLSDPSKHPTLAQFQADVRRSLDKSFGQFVRVSEAGNSNGHTVFRAEAVGTVEEIEIAWVYYLVQSNEGRQVVFAFTCEQGLLERMGDADQAIIDTLQFAEPATTAAQPTLAPTVR
ncbi:MAG: hypothetical protein QM775_18900 [Pirellulales bacterium]